MKKLTLSVLMVAAVMEAKVTSFLLLHATHITGQRSLATTPTHLLLLLVTCARVASSVIVTEGGQNPGVAEQNRELGGLE